MKYRVRMIICVIAFSLLLTGTAWAIPFADGLIDRYAWFHNYDESIWVGESFPLTYGRLSETAGWVPEVQVSPKGKGKLELVEDIYVFTPYHSGTFTFTMFDGEQKLDEGTLEVRSNLTDIRVQPGSLHLVNFRYLAYMGQSHTFTVDLIKRDPGQMGSLKTLYWRIGDGPETKGSSDGFKVTFNQLGDQMLHVRMLEDDHTYTLPLHVESVTKAIEAPKTIFMGVGTRHKPVFKLVPRQTIYQLESEPLTDVTFEVTETYVSKSYLDQELAFEEEQIAILKRSDQPEDAVQLKEHLMRWGYVRALFDNVNGEYAVLTPENKLTDREGRQVQLLDVHDGRLHAAVPGRVMVQVTPTESNITETFEVVIEEERETVEWADQTGNLHTEEEDRLQMLFADLPVDSRPSDWAVAEVGAALEAGLFQIEEDTDFQESMSRYAFTLLAMNLFEKLGGVLPEQVDKNPFQDVDDERLSAAAQLGIVTGVDPETFAPDRKITRQESAVILQQVVDVVGVEIEGSVLTDTEKLFADEALVADWAKEAVRLMSHTFTVMTGNERKELLPRAKTTREQAVIMLFKAYQEVQSRQE